MTASIAEPLTTFTDDDAAELAAFVRGSVSAESARESLPYWESAVADFVREAGDQPIETVVMLLLARLREAR